MDARHYQTLLNALKQRDYGRTTWLEFKEKLRWVDLSTADFTRRSMRGFDLSGADLSMAICRETDLTEADLSDANLKCADLRRAELRCAILDRARLTVANLQDANLADACLEGAVLTRAKLARATLTGADLAGADLTGADLSGACLRYARLTGARLLGADVSGADLTGAVLDDNAPTQVVNFSKSRIEKRAYQDMRSRVELAPEEPDDEISQARLLKVDSRRPQPRPGRTGDGRVGDGPPRAEEPPKAEQPKAEARPKGYVPPVRDAEPDLSTVEGCCQVLEVPSDASMDQIVKAFRAKAKLYHPDKVRHLSERMQELAAEEFRRLRRAYEALTRRTARPLTGVNWPEGMPRYTSPYDYSVEQYEILARLNPANTNILYNLAWKWFEDGRYAEARAGFMRVLSFNPGDLDAQYNLIIIRLYTELLLPSLSE